MAKSITSSTNAGDSKKRILAADSNKDSLLLRRKQKDRTLQEDNSTTTMTTPGTMMTSTKSQEIEMQQEPMEDTTATSSVDAAATGEGVGDVSVLSVTDQEKEDGKNEEQSNSSGNVNNACTTLVRGIERPLVAAFTTVDNAIPLNAGGNLRTALSCVSEIICPAFSSFAISGSDGAGIQGAASAVASSLSEALPLLVATIGSIGGALQTCQTAGNVAAVEGLSPSCIVDSIRGTIDQLSVTAPMVFGISGAQEVLQEFMSCVSPPR